MRLFPPSEIDHPWRETLALVAVSVWVSLGLAWLITGPFLWLLQRTGPIDWHIGEIDA